MPDAPRPFRAPWVPLIPVLGVISCLVLMVFLPIEHLGATGDLAGARAS